MGAWIRAVAMAAIDRRRVGTSKGMTPLPRLAPIVAILACVPREAAPPVLPSLSATRATPAPASVRNAAPDEDRDGVPDGVDLCAGEEEVRNAYRDDDGCPDEQPVPLLRAFSGGLGRVSFVPKPRPQRGSPVVEWLSARMDEWAAEDTWLREHPLDASTRRSAPRRGCPPMSSHGCGGRAPCGSASGTSCSSWSGSPRPVRVARRPNARRSGWSAPRRYGGSSSSRRTCRPRSSRSGRRGPRIGRTTTRWSGLEVATLPAVDQQETHRARR
jgi:hypothetical protein